MTKAPCGRRSSVVVFWAVVTIVLETIGVLVALGAIGYGLMVVAG